MDTDLVIRAQRGDEEAFASLAELERVFASIRFAESPAP